MITKRIIIGSLLGLIFISLPIEIFSRVEGIGSFLAGFFGAVVGSTIAIITEG